MSNPPSPYLAPAERLARRIVQTLQQAGHVAYYAGGCVRDRLMGREPADFDVATSARPEEVLRLFPKSQKVGVAFGVVIVRDKRQTVEVATFRAEGAYSDGRRPDSVRFTTAEEDAQRRDFTCNGLFLDPIANTLHDFVGGQADIQARILRAIGDPAQRFSEDHLRLLRAVRFAAKLSFAIAPTTWDAMVAMAPKIVSVSRERIGEEIRMMLEHPRRGQAVALLESSGLLARLWPRDLFAPVTDWPCANRLEEPVSRVVGLAAMQHDMGVAGTPPAAMADLLRNALVLSNDETQDLAWLLERIEVIHGWPTLRVAAFKRILADRRWPQLRTLYRAQTPDESLRAALNARVAELHRDRVAPAPYVTGDDLISLGATPGRQFKAWLETLYDQQLENVFPDRAAALAAARTLVGS